MPAFDPAGLLDLADEVDPADAHLVAELEALGNRVLDLARYADLLADAAYNPAAAFEQRRRHQLQDAVFRTRHADLADESRAPIILNLSTGASYSPLGRSGRSGPAAHVRNYDSSTGSPNLIVPATIAI